LSRYLEKEVGPLTECAHESRLAERLKRSDQDRRSRQSQLLRLQDDVRHASRDASSTGVMRAAPRLHHPASRMQFTTAEDVDGFSRADRAMASPAALG